MRGQDRTSGSLFSYVDLDSRIPARHPLRAMREIVNEALDRLDASVEALYKDGGRPSIPPERLLRAALLHRGSEARTYPFVGSSTRRERIWLARVRACD